MRKRKKTHSKARPKEQKPTTKQIKKLKEWFGIEIGPYIPEQFNDALNISEKQLLQV